MRITLFLLALTLSCSASASPPTEVASPTEEVSETDLMALNLAAAQADAAKARWEAVQAHIWVKYHMDAADSFDDKRRIVRAAKPADKSKK